MYMLQLYRKNQYTRLPVYIDCYTFHDPQIPEPQWFNEKITRDNLQRVYDPHAHKELEVHYVRRGRIYARVDMNTIKLNAGDILIVNPYVVHDGYLDPQAGITEYVHTTFNMQHFLGNCGKNVMEVVNDLCSGRRAFAALLSAGHSGADKIASTLDTLLELDRMPQARFLTADCCTVGAVCHLFGYLLDYVPIERCRADYPREIQFVQQVQDYIEQHYCEHLRMEDVAVALSYSKSYFCTRFKESFGKSFSHYLNEFRIQRAAVDYFDSTLPLTEIAFRVGFVDYCYFSRSFKKYMQMSPSEYFKSVVR